MITHKGTQIIQTERLTLRRFTVDDAQDMFDNWASDERVTRYLTWLPHESPQVTRQILESWCVRYDDTAFYNWAMEYDGRAIGNISVVRFDQRFEYCDLGYCMGYAYWNKGLMTEASRAVIDFLFSKVGVNRVGISHALGNDASGRVAQKCGLTFEGTKREYYKTTLGEFLDISDYGILRKEWEKAGTHTQAGMEIGG